MISGGTEKDIQASELLSGTMLREFADAMPVGACIVRERRIAFANSGLVAMTGFTEAELTGRSLVEGLVHPEDAIFVSEGMEKIISCMAGNYHCQCRIVKKDGGLIEVELAATYVSTKSGPALICTSVDITEKKRLKKEKAELLSMVTHDFKSPLSTIMGYAELLATGESGGMDIRVMAEVIQKSGRKLLDMVDDFQFHAKLDTGTITPRFAPVDINGILVEVGKNFALQAALKKQTLETGYAEDVPMLYLDARLVERALFNLVQNAVNYTPEGGSIRVTPEFVPGDDGGSVAISVSDTGPGISAEQASRLFDLYYRSSETRGVRGAGMGLTIVKAVAGAHGGSVELSSEPGKGSTFKLVLPVMPADL